MPFAATSEYALLRAHMETPPPPVPSPSSLPSPRRVPVLPWVVAGIAAIAAAAAILRGPSSPPPMLAPAPTALPTAAPATPAPALTPQTASFAQAQRGEVVHFENTLGMRFVPVPRTAVLFSVWEARVQDYRAFAQETRREWPKPDFSQGDDHPAVNVSWEDAAAFCEWLTKREQRSGRITAQQRCRLPTDEEWSWAVGLPPESGRTPQEKNRKMKDVYPWDKGRGTWPPKRGTEGNYCGQETKGKAGSMIAGYTDRRENTAPVGSYEVNANGLYDLGGNAWEWCEDEYEPGKPTRVLRGGSWVDVNPAFLLSSFRFFDGPGYRYVDRGFRPVLAGDLSRRGWSARALSFSPLPFSFFPREAPKTF